MVEQLLEFLVRVVDTQLLEWVDLMKEIKETCRNPQTPVDTDRCQFFYSCLTGQTGQSSPCSLFNKQNVQIMELKKTDSNKRTGPQSFYCESVLKSNALLHNTIGTELHHSLWTLEQRSIQHYAVITVNCSTDVEALILGANCSSLQPLQCVQSN